MFPSTMKQFVCESLFSFLQLNEDLKLAEDIFAKMDVSTNDPLYKDFFTFFKDPKYQYKFAEWLQNKEAKIRTLKIAFKAEKSLEKPLDKKIDQFVSFDDYIEAIESKQEEQEKKSEEEE